MTRLTSISDAQKLLECFGFDEERRNERSAKVLLALAKLKVTDDWKNASNEMYTTRELMDWMRDKLDTDYKPNTRETIRRFTLHQFALVGFVEENADKPNRPINSPKWNYRLTARALQVIKLFNTAKFTRELAQYKKQNETWLEKQQEQRDTLKVHVQLPNGASKLLSSGGQSLLIKNIIDDFCSRFAGGAKVVFIGDTSQKNEIIDKTIVEKLHIHLPKHGKKPDVILYSEQKKWLFLMEACSTHGPIDVTRKNELIKTNINYVHTILRNIKI